MLLRKLGVVVPIALVLVAVAVISQRRTRVAPVAVTVRPPAHQDAVRWLTGLGDDELAAAGFTVTRPGELRIYALGEGIDGTMYDYGWIVDAATHRVVWRMEYDHTGHAGGATKNRVVDEVVGFEPGNYLMYYGTDDSHSWGDWNATPPEDADGWGISLFVTEGTVAEDLVEPYEPATDPSIVVGLTRIGDDEDRRERFELAQETELRVYALGEGLSGEMYDFAWIEDERSGQEVWRMTFSETKHAGGAEKNRLYDAVVRLPVGAYMVHYESDGSHSFEDWNATPPEDPLGYGITLFRVERRNDETRARSRS